MSSETVTGNALQFTNDNKNAYASSGFLLFDNTETTLLNFKTESYYLITTLMPMRNDTDSLDSNHRVYFNDILVNVFPISSGGNQFYPGPPVIIIPPSTNVKITILNVSNTSNGYGGVSLMAKVGMPQRVGNE